MIRCKLISPTNLMLEHPLLFSTKDESEFFVIGKKEYTKIREGCIRFGVLVGIASAVAATGLASLIVAFVK